jgi:glycosyltransferase 2 family protein
VPASARGALRINRGFYASDRAQPRVRRASDVVLLAAALLALVGLVVSQPPGELERSFLRFLQAFPSWLEPIWAMLVAVLAVWAALMLLAPVVSRRPRIAVEAALAVVLAAGIALVASRAATGDWPGAQAISGLSNDLHFPGMRLAMASAVICVANAHVTRPVATTGWWLLALGAAASMLQGATTVGGTGAALLIGAASGAAVRLALGTSAGLPSVRGIAFALADLGIAARDLEPAERQSAGAYTVRATEPDGGALTIRVYGRDAYDNHVLERLWRKLWYRDGGPAVRSLNRAYGAEREALLTLLARSAGASAADVVMVGGTARGDALIVLRIAGRPLDSLEAQEVDDDLLRAHWSAVERLAQANIAHAQIDPQALRVWEGGVGFSELGRGTVAPDHDELLTDRAQLLAATAAAAGSERAVAAAVAAVGRDGITELLPYLQPAAFSSQLRRALKLARIDVDDLRARAAAAAGTQEPELARLRRVTWGTALQIGLLMLGGGAIIKFVSGVQIADFEDALSGASWGWIAAGLVVAQLPRVSQAVEALGAIPARVPFGPVYLLQLAMGYINLAVPTGLARIAVTTRFLQRQGVPPAAAATSSTIHPIASNVVQAVLLVSLLAFSKTTVDLDLNRPSAGALRILYLLIGLAAVVLIGGALLGVGRRARAAARAAFERWWPQVRDAFGVLRRSDKLAQIILGNVASELLFATALGLFARGVGFPVSIADLLVINISTSLFSSLIPVPGGIGVVEGGLAVGLSSAGMPQAAALSAALLYRIATSYLPPLWGWFALQWLRRHEYL